MTEAGRLIFGVICAVNQQIRKRLECLQILVKLMKIVQKSPDLVLSSTLNTYTTDLINFQSAQIEIPSEKEERMELMILYSVLILL